MRSWISKSSVIACVPMSGGLINPNAAPDHTL
jgi:hypothetical protein